MGRPIEIGLLWHSDSNRNLGVGALTVGNMALVREAAAQAGREPRFHLFAPRDQRPPYVEGFASRHAITRNFLLAPSGYWRAIGRLDVMLDIGAGDSFTDIYFSRRFAFLIATKYACIARGVPLVLSPQTIGPFTRQPHTALAAAALRRAALIFVRDPMSADAVRTLAPRARLFQSIDVAFALPFTPAPKGPGLRVGVNVSGLLYSGGYTGRNDFGLELDYWDYTHRLIDSLLAEPGVTVELIPHVDEPNLPNDDDGRAADLLADRYPEVVRVPSFRSPVEAKSYISGLDFLVGARMHATIAAYSAGVPVVPVSYSRKFEGLYGALGYAWLVPARGMATDAALALTLEAFHRRDELAAAIRDGDAVVQQGLQTYVAALADLFGSLR
ncbi:polysaccharide pyruvyl transferase family protein [Thermaurantiacus sp.]